MAVKSKAAYTKRQKERRRQEKQLEKRARRMEARGREASGGSENEDPDIEGIRLGPQPRPDEP